MLPLHATLADRLLLLTVGCWLWSLVLLLLLIAVALYCASSAGVRRSVFTRLFLIEIGQNSLHLHRVQNKNS